jgi:methionyl-tRNA synthetase
MLFDRLNISNDDFIRTTEERHRKSVEVFVTKLHDSGAFYEDEYEGLYCTGCERFITEKELVDGKCPDHKKAPERIKEKNYFFKLREYLPQVKDMIARGEIKVEPESRKKEVLGLLDHDVLDDFSISRESVKWGIRVPYDHSQIIYVWVEALQNYISAIGYGRDEAKFNKFWPADVHVMAKDIIKFHAIFWPAMLIAAGLNPPKKIFAHGFFTVNGDKMSKSIGNVIDPNELIDTFGADATRYLLLSQFPFGQDGDIKADRFLEQYNTDLAGGISNILHRSISMTEKYFNSVVQERPESSIVDTQLVADVIDEYHEGLEGMKIDHALKQILHLVRHGNEIIEQYKPWELAKNDTLTLGYVLYDILELNRIISFMLYPFMPNVAEKMHNMLGVDYEEHMSIDELLVWGVLPVGTQIKKGEPLFMRK